MNNPLIEKMLDRVKTANEQKDSVRKYFNKVAVPCLKKNRSLIQGE